MLCAAGFHQSKHVPENGLLPPSRGCPVCGGEVRKRVVSLQQDPDVAFLRCKTCSAVSASRMPRPETLDTYYADYYSVQNKIKSAEANVTIDGPDRLARRIFSRMRPAVPGVTVRILDFGGGDGTISRSCAELIGARHKNQVIIDLVDYSARSLVLSAGTVLVNAHRDLPPPDGLGYELVLASGILEHVPDPGVALKSSLERLAPDGIFYARTPAMAEIAAVLSLSGLRIDLTFPAHLHDLGQAFWDQALERLHLEKEFLLRVSRPSIVETTVRHHFGRTLVAHAMKLPWRALGRLWPYVGGWEVIMSRSRQA